MAHLTPDRPHRRTPSAISAITGVRSSNERLDYCWRRAARKTCYQTWRIVLQALRVVVVDDDDGEQKATAAGDVRRLQTPSTTCHCRMPYAVPPLKPILTTSWFDNKVNDVLLVLQLRVVAPGVEVCGRTLQRQRHLSSSVRCW